MIYMISCLMSHFDVVDIHVKLFQIMWYVKGSKGTALKAQFHTVFVNDVTEILGIWKTCPRALQVLFTRGSESEELRRKGNKRHVKLL